MERQTNLDQADRSLPNPNDSRRAPVCFDGTGKTDPDMLVGGLFPREDQRSTRTDVTKLTRNGVELLACPPADVGFIRGSRMTGRRAAVGRLDWGTFSPTGVLLGGRDPAQSKEQATDSGHCLQRCQAVEQQQEFLGFRPSSIEPVVEADLSGGRASLNLRRARSPAFSLSSQFARVNGERPMRAAWRFIVCSIRDSKVSQTRPATSQRSGICFSWATLRRWL